VLWEPGLRLRREGGLGGRVPLRRDVPLQLVSVRCAGRLQREHERIGARLRRRVMTATHRSGVPQSGVLRCLRTGLQKGTSLVALHGPSYAGDRSDGS
jgi:hypothetical protein